MHLDSFLLCCVLVICFFFLISSIPLHGFATLYSLNQLEGFWVCFCRSFLSLVFTGYVILFSICCKAGLVVLNSLNFCLSVKLLISPSILNEVFAGYHNLSCRFLFFQYFKYILPFPFGLPHFS